MIKCENYLRYFKKYSDEFFCQVKEEDKFKIELKIVHTMKVLRIMRILAREVGLSGEDYEVAKIIALFHDFGRFNQLKLYGHFNDRTSIKHGEESVRELKRLNILDLAGSNYVPEKTKVLIYKSIENHNRDEILADFDNDVDNEKLILMSKLIRDADKIDIYRSVSEYMGRAPLDVYLKTMNGFTSEKEVSDNVYDKIKNGIKLKRDDIVTIGDKQIWEFYWSISDMNFPISLKIIKERRYLENVHDVLASTGKMLDCGKINELYNYILNELDKRVENGIL